MHWLYFDSHFLRGSILTSRDTTRLIEYFILYVHAHVFYSFFKGKHDNSLSPAANSSPLLTS